jgi:AcrR family transcriptional regulator
MMDEKEKTTEEKIKAAARAVFHRKGYAAARSRDIAEEAGINLALLNYYFRSKERLFSIVMLETFQSFFASVVLTLNDPQTTLEEKVEKLVERYIDMLLEAPEVPLFLATELRRDPDALIGKVQAARLIPESILVRQYEDAVREGRIRDVPFIQFMINLMGLIIFPFFVSPMLKAVGDLRDEEFRALMIARKKEIPEWLRTLMQPPIHQPQ